MTMITVCKSETGLRTLDEGEGRIAGYASLFSGTDSSGDTILPGAYAEALKGAMPGMFFNHDVFDLPIGKWTELHEDEKGLYVEGQLDLGREDVQKIWHAVKFGSLDALSVRILVDPRETASRNGSRVISKINRLCEISLVTLPADGGARLTDIKGDPGTVRDFERTLRDAGLSKTQAATLCARAKAIFGQCDADERKAEMEQIASKLSAIDNLLKGRK